MAFLKKKSLGQHFLRGSAIPKIMCQSAEITPEDLVLEIGPGTGALTKILLKNAKKVIALETDERAIQILNETFETEIGEGKLLILHLDVRELHVEDLPVEQGSYTVVSNIPYYLSGHLFRVFLEAKNSPKTIVFLVQKEVAKRITDPKKESILSLSVKVFGTPKYIKTVSRSFFSPPPKVDSAIIAIENISHKNLENIDSTFFFSLLHTGFGSKRKKLAGNLRALLDTEHVIQAFSTCSLETNSRAEDVPLEKWLCLAKTIVSHS